MKYDIRKKVNTEISKTKGKRNSGEFKAKIALKTIKGEQMIAEIAFGIHHY